MCLHRGRDLRVELVDDVRRRAGVDDEVCTGDHSCIRLSGCPSLVVKPSPDPLRSDPVAHVNNGCVGCGLCGEVADAAVLCPSFYKADIVQNAIDLAHVLGIAEPRVAILSAVETVNPKIQSTLDAAALCKMADRRQITGGVLDGPLAFDNAISADAARSKGIKSPVSGLADILVVPDLESGNMVAKQLEYLANALTEYRNGNRKHPTMQAQAQSFSDQDIADIAAFLSTVK